MQPADLFAQCLGLTPPWKIVKVEFVDDEVHIRVDFEHGAKFEGLPVHDTAVRVWRNWVDRRRAELDFGQPRRARGYRNPQNLIAVSYLLHDKLDPATHTK